MAYRVVMPFVYSTDGIHGVELVPGDVRDGFGDCSSGLLAEGYIELVAEDAPVGEVVAAVVAVTENRPEPIRRRRK